MTSKEMTPKEALDRLLMLARPCYYEVREHRKIYCDMLENTINQALDRLEQLEIADRNNQNLVKTNVELVNKNLKLQNENQGLKEKAKKYDEIVNLKTTPNVIEKSLADYMNKCIALEKENQELKEYFDQIASGDTIINLFRDNAKLKKVIKLLIDIEMLTYGDLVRKLNNNMITQQEYDLIKEVLENEN